jgi:hypothetical protein
MLTVPIPTPSSGTSSTRRPRFRGSPGVGIQRPSIVAAIICSYAIDATCHSLPDARADFGVYYVVGRDGYARAFPDTSPALLADAIRAEL